MTPGSIKAGRAFILIEAVDATGKVMQAIGNKLRSWGRNLMMTGMNMAFQSFLGGSAIALTTSTFLRFDDAMRRVQARSEGTLGELDALRRMAIKLSEASALSATDIANLMAELAQMGFTRSQIAQMADPISLLAQAGGTGNKTLDAINSAKLVSGTLRAMNMDFSQAAYVADIYAQSLNLSNAALEDMATAMAYAAPAAYRYKVSLEDTVSVIGYLRNLNIDAETAGTGFRNMLLEMSESKGRDKFNAMLDTMTGKLINFVDESGNLRKPTDLLFAIGEAMKGLGTAEQGELLFTLFGKRAIIPASALAEGKNPFEQMREQMSGVEGVAGRMRDVMEGGLGGAWRRLTNSISAASIMLGEAWAPAMQTASKQIKETIFGLTDWVIKNRGLVTTLAVAIPIWGLLAGTLLLVGFHLRLLGTLILPLATGFRLVALTVRLLSQGFVFLIGSIRLLGIGFRVVTMSMIAFANIGGTFRIVMTGLAAVMRLLQYATIAYNLTAASTRILLRVIAAEAVIWIGIGQMLVGMVRLFYLLSMGARITSISIIGFGTAMRTAQAASTGMVLAVRSTALATTTAVTGLSRLSYAAMSTVHATSRILSGVVTLTRVSLMGLSDLLYLAFVQSGRLAAMAMVGLASSLALLLNPLVLVGAGLAALVYFNREGIFNVMESSIKSTGDTLRSVGDDLKLWLNDVKSAAIGIAGTIKSSFMGISAAMALGDMQIAWEIALNGLKTAWLQLKDILMDSWEGFIMFFQEAWAGAINYYTYQAERVRTLGIDEFVSNAAYDEEGNKIREGRRMNREEYLADYRARLEEKTAKEINNIRSQYDDEDEERQIDIAEAKAELKAKLAELEGKQHAAMIDEMLAGWASEDEKAKLDEAMKAMEGLIGVGAGGTGLGTEIKDGLLRGSSEAAKAMYESISLKPDEKSKEFEQRQQILERLDELIVVEEGLRNDIAAALGNIA